VVSENFKPGTMAKLGLDYETLHQVHPQLIYVSHKGFLPGPYDHRTALDEVVQMMGGLAYMTGPEDRPLRAGSSVNDIMGGIFGAIGVMAALRQRDLTGLGQEIQSALFENNIFFAFNQFSVGVSAMDIAARSGCQREARYTANIELRVTLLHPLRYSLACLRPRLITIPLRRSYSTTPLA
jgi:crotonobetainyl-CoA:carnitine CoA-transferase CaiB-like acyl-CoA transferase